MKPLQRLGPLDHISLPSGVFLEFVTIHGDSITYSMALKVTVSQERGFIIANTCLKEDNGVSRLSLGSSRTKCELVGANVIFGSPLCPEFEINIPI